METGLINVSLLKRLFQPAPPVERQLQWIPLDVGYTAHRYDTDDEIVLHLWKDGKSYDIRLPKNSEVEITVGVCC